MTEREEVSRGTIGLEAVRARLREQYGEQRHAAAAMGLGPPTLSELLSGKSPMTPYYAARIAFALGDRDVGRALVRAQSEADYEIAYATLEGDRNA